MKAHRWGCLVTPVEGTGVFCVDHPSVELVKPDHGRHLECTSRMHGGDTGYRRCTVCGGPDGSWLSGTCDSCYRRISSENAESQREHKRRSTERYVLADLRRQITESGRNPIRVIDEWIEARS